MWIPLGYIIVSTESLNPDITPDTQTAANSEQDATSVADIERLVVSLIEENRTVIVYGRPVIYELRLTSY